VINGLSYREVSFDAAGKLLGDDGLVAAVAAGGIDDVFIFSHGWNNSVDTARDLYNRMFTLLSTSLGAHRERTASVGILWPSLLFPEDEAGAAPAPAAAGQHGAALAKALAPAFPDQTANVAKLGALLDEKPQDAQALETFHKLAAGLVTTPNPGGPEDAGEEAAITGKTAAVLGAYSAMAKSTPSAAEGLGNPFTALWTGARETLRTLSYYEMKNRAGVVGEKGLGPLIGRLTPPAGQTVRVHLMGHSFGARLVSFSLRGLPAAATGSASPVKSLFLVQGAFSHFAFADPMPIDHSRKGALAPVRSHVDGPVLATFSAADRAVGWWYPTASMLKHEDSESVSDLNYRWGGMGHDGYQQDGVAELKLQKDGAPYAFARGAFYRLDSNAVIAEMQSQFAGAHSDIVHPEVVWAAVSAAGLST
jgi:hypothetical protein